MTSEQREIVVIELIQGVEGPCLAINDYRVAGPKPWGGGRVVKRWEVQRERVVAALAEGREVTP